MRVTVFTSNQPRHISLVESLAEIADEVYAVHECTTVFPGKIAGFYRKSEVMQRYFAQVIEAEREVFGPPRFTPSNARHLLLQPGDLNLLKMPELQAALQSDFYVVFGASFIKGPLCEFLVEKRAYNIHMGTSPYYRGSSCNFWALYDERADYVGATIHLLSKGLDSGPMLFHALPKSAVGGPFRVGMRAVQAAHRGLLEAMRSGELEKLEPMPQDKRLEYRYTRNSDFTDEVAQAYLERAPSAQVIQEKLDQRDLSRFLRPFVF